LFNNYQRQAQAMAVAMDDLLSERFIAQLLDNDLLLLDSIKEAEKLQLDQCLIPEFSKVATVSSAEMDANLAFRLYVSDAQIKNDEAFAQSVQNETHVEHTTNHQYALKVAAAER
jgi:hypothetical protein